MHHGMHHQVSVPAEFAGIPQLSKRATVEFVLKKGPDAESSQFDIDGNLFKTATLRMQADGYTSPVQCTMYYIVHYTVHSIVHYGHAAHAGRRLHVARDGGQLHRPRQPRLL